MDDKITIDFSKLLVVPINQVRPNTYNPKDKNTKQFAEVKASIEKNGLRGFIVVRERADLVGEDGLMIYEIIDGEQRWTACSELGFEKVVIYNEGVVEDKRAQELTLWWDVHVEKNELSLAKLISGMIEKFGEIETPFSGKKIEEMQELAKFNFDNYKKTQNSQPPAPTGDLMQSFMVQLTKDQYEVLQQAFKKVRGVIEGEIGDARALELVCVEYINQEEGQ